ncbi:MAG: VCBS repeat-containing protein [Acidobacteriota bacterium]
MKRFPLLLILAASACSSSSQPGKAPSPGSPRPTPTPSILARIDPDVIEDTDTYVIRRLPKARYIRVDDHHIRLPIVATPMEFFKEDDEYYYVSTPKRLPDEIALKKRAREQEAKPPTKEEAKKEESLVPLADFEDLSPARVSGRLKLEEIPNSGLPPRGMWRASFAVADVNGDGILDIVSPPARMGDGKLRIFLGDGKGRFSDWPLTFTDAGKPTTRFFLDYGGVAVGDIDGDGKMDIVCASHNTGLTSLFGDGAGGFRIVKTGLPTRDFSAQSIALADADGDGKLDLIAARDVPPETAKSVDKTQVRVYLFRGVDKGWQFKADGIVGGFYSQRLSTFDFDGDGRKDVLTGSHQAGALTLLWKNDGNGTFSPVSLPVIEIYSFHFATAPGTLGRDRAAAFADSFYMSRNSPSTKAGGISVYAFRKGEWTRHRIWRKKDLAATVSALAMGDLDGDGLDDVVFADSEQDRLRVLFQQPDGSFVEAAEAEEPALNSPGECVRLADIDGDGRLDILLSKTVKSSGPTEPGGWNVYLNRR